MSILIGTAGFSYDDWRGHFYPRSLKRGDMLSFYSRCFPAVELNTTYYGLPAPATVEQMTRKVPAGFEFVVKAHADMTHSGEFKPEVFAQFREAVAPLREAGMLGGVLAQFPWSFRRTPANHRYLSTLRSEIPETPVVVELRNAEWIVDETFERLRAEGLGFCCVDEPRLKGLVPPVVAATSSTTYVRFHGRNWQKWWRHQHAYERYDYLYNAQELAEWLPKVQQLAAESEKTYVFFNNHYEGKAGQNARQLAELLNQPLPWPDAEADEESKAQQEGQLGLALEA